MRNTPLAVLHHSTLVRVTFGLFSLLAASSLSASSPEALDWPKEIHSGDEIIVVYQPQPEALEGKTLTGRAAMSIERSGDKLPVYGVFWFSAQIDTDRSQDLASISRVKVLSVNWPDAKDTGEQYFTHLVEGAVAGTVFHASLSGLRASLTASDKQKQSLEEIKNDPPNIEFREELAVLLLYDGKPKFKRVENSPFERALNSPMVVVKDTRNEEFYLTSGDLWYQSSIPLGPWKVTKSPPQDLVAMIPKSEVSGRSGVPAIVTVTEPTELIVTTGKPEWISLSGGKVLYVQNTETPWVRDLASGNMYVQLSGRWYRSASQGGPWVFVRGDKLPDSFKEIPPASDIGGVRSSVAGTEEAKDAVADAQIPQTAAIKRDKATLKVEYDGPPKFETIKGTDVAYAVNTGAQVLRIDGKYYAVDNGVWFVAKVADGPWIVADAVPSEKIAAIPPSSPVYNTTYVKIYSATPQVVYVGYTPGYLWSFSYYGVPIYGTGWYYPPYWGTYYYPRPVTWGFHVGYNPWVGWTYGVSWGAPFYAVGVSWGGGWGAAYYRTGGCCYGWYGGGYNHTEVNINTGNINIGNSVNVGNRTKIEKNFTNNASKTNIYTHSKNLARNADKSAVHNNLTQAKGNSDRKNNLFADNQGQVARKSAEQWQVREKNAWQDVSHDNTQGLASRKAQNFSGQSHNNPLQTQQRPQFDHNRMNRDFEARQRGNSRSGKRGHR